MQRAISAGAGRREARLLAAVGIQRRPIRSKPEVAARSALRFCARRKAEGRFQQAGKEARFQLLVLRHQRFSITVISRNRRTCWKVRTTPMRDLLAGKPSRCRSAQRSPYRLSAYKTGQAVKHRRFTRAVGANQRTISRSRNSSDTLLTASKPPKRIRLGNR